MKFRITQNNYRTAECAENDQTGTEIGDTRISVLASQYIVAIAKFIGCEGLSGPVKEVHGDTEYTFDFVHEGCQTRYKIFTADQLGQYEKYAKYPGAKRIIINVEGSAVTVPGQMYIQKTMVLWVNKAITERVKDDEFTSLYFRGQLWKLDREEIEKSIWWPMPHVQKENVIEKFWEMYWQALFKSVEQREQSADLAEVDE